MALDTPLRRLFDYLPPAGRLARARRHARARAVWPAAADRCRDGDLRPHRVPPERLKPVLEVLDAEPVLDAAALALLAWAAEYYHHPLGEVVAGALPKALRLGAPSVATRGALDR